TLFRSNVAVADLPVAPLEVDAWPRPVAAGQHVHAAILWCHGPHRDPDADDRRVDRHVEIGMVLMPGLLAPARRLDERHVLEELRRGASQELPDDGQQARMPR